MRILVLGGSGMLGHKLWQVLTPQFDTYVTFREEFTSYSEYGIFDATRSRCKLSVSDIGSIEDCIEELQPDVVINCIGVVKQSKAAKDPLISIAVNSLFPHQVAQVCRRLRSRLIHISTDCVFSGRDGDYIEDDVSDAQDLYGRSKYLGEVTGEDCLTIRTSLIGRELQGANGLIEWFISQAGKTVSGYKKAIFNGLTTIAFAKLLAMIIRDQSGMSGIWHVASEPISKHDLLALVNDIYNLSVRITPDETVIVDRSLNADRFRGQTGYITPSWQTMLEEMYQDDNPYSELRRTYADG